MPPTTSVPPECNPCPGWHSEDSITAELCQCPEGKLWNGEICINRTECPCYVGYIAYAVGTLFDSQNCEECICKIGGIASCKEKVCPHCEQVWQNLLICSWITSDLYHVPEISVYFNAFCYFNSYHYVPLNWIEKDNKSTHCLLNKHIQQNEL